MSQQSKCSKIVQGNNPQATCPLRKTKEKWTPIDPNKGREESRCMKNTTQYESVCDYAKKTPKNEQVSGQRSSRRDPFQKNVAFI